MQPPEVDKAFPKGWQSLPYWLRLRIARLSFALPFCRGRASDLSAHVASEIALLTRRLQERAPLYDHIWFWKGTFWRPVYRKGERCRVYCRASKNSIGVEFEDGTRYCTSRHAVRPMQVKDAVPIQAYSVPNPEHLRTSSQETRQLTFDDLLQ